MMNDADQNEYMRFRANPAHDAMTDSQWCAKQGVEYADLTSWKVTNPRLLELVLTTRRARYADEMIKIDAALLAKAKSGDARSIQLAWARFENWSPRIEEEQNKKTGGKTKSFAELIAEQGG